MALRPEPLGVRSSRLRAGLLTVALASTLVHCGNDPTAPSPADGFISIDLNPSGGDLTWEHGLNRPLRLTPPLAWRVDFVSPVAAWTLDVQVDLLDAAGATCLTSSGSVEATNRAFPYLVEGSTFRLPDGSLWHQGPCGNDFTIDAVRVIVMYGHIISPDDPGGKVVGTLTVPCRFRVTRTGDTGGPPPA